MNRIIVSAVVICGSVALLAPNLRQVDEDPQDLAVSFQMAASDPQVNQVGTDWYAGGTTLQRGPNGHFYTSAYVDGATVNFMIDTGASVIALTGSDAAAAGLQWDEAQVRHIGSGASGPVYGVEAILRQVEVDGIVQKDVQAVIIPEGLEVSLLGQSFLSRIDNVEIQGDRMVLGGG